MNAQMPIQVIFLGSSESAVRALERLLSCVCAYMDLQVVPSGRTVGTMWTVKRLVSWMSLHQKGLRAFGMRTIGILG